MSLTLAEARDRAAHVEVESYAIGLDLTGWERGRFGCSTTVRFTTTSPRTFLELLAAEDVTVESGEGPLAWEYDGRRITLDGLPTGRPVEVVVRGEVPYVSDGDGMHLMTDPEDGETYISAYLSLDVAQRVFACFDQPDLKATFAVSVTADRRWTVLGNGRVAEHDEQAGRFVFYTNLASRKGRALAAEPRTALLFPWHPLERQVRVEGVAEPLGRAEVEAYFAQRPRGSQLGAHASAQSEPVTGRAALEAAYAAVGEEFAGRDVPPPEHWGGYAVRAEVVEFWQGRPSRLHDRLECRRTEGGWEHRRLAP